MKAIGYVRVSTAEQAEEGVSIDAQRDRIAAWCVLNDCELTQVHVDAGISGKRADNRPALKDAIDEATQTGAVLVVYSLSRLARSTRDTLDIAERLEKAGADLVSLSEKIDTTSAAGKMIFRMLAVLAEFERDVISERTKTALQHKKRNGERVGTVPFGFKLAADGIRLIENPAEQEVIGLIHELKEAGQSSRAIADELTQRNIPTKKGGKRWAHTAVIKILKRVA